MGRNKLSTLLLASLILSSLTLVGCSENKRNEVTSKITDSENGASVEGDITQEEKYRIMERLMTSELMCFNEFEKATDLHQDEAIYYCYILEYGNDESLQSSLFKKYNIDINKENVSLPIALVNELLKKYFNEDDISLFNSERSKYRVEVTSISDKEVTIDNSGFGGGGRELDLVNVVNDKSDYRFIVNLVTANSGTVVDLVDPNEPEEDGCEYTDLTDVSGPITMGAVDGKIEKGKKYKIIARDGDIIEKREYRLGKHKDGDYYLKSMKILEKCTE